MLHIFTGKLGLDRIEKKHNQFYNRLYSVDKNKYIILIKEFRFYAWPIYHHVSKDGKAIAYLRKLENNENLMVVLIKE